MSPHSRAFYGGGKEASPRIGWISYPVHSEAELAFNVGDGGDAVLDVELVAFDVAAARFDNFELVHLLYGVREIGRGKTKMMKKEVRPEWHFA